MGDLPERHDPCTKSYNRWSKTGHWNRLIDAVTAAYDTEGPRQEIEVQGAAPNMTSKANRNEKRRLPKSHCKERNRIERFLNKIKHPHCIAKRFEVDGPNHLDVIGLASIRIWMRHDHAMDKS